MDINHKRKFNKDEPFTLVTQATQVYNASYLSMKHDKVNWWNVWKITLRQVIDAPTTNLTFQEDKIMEHSNDNVDDVLGPLNDSIGGFMDVYDRYDSSLEDETESNCEIENKLEDDEVEHIIIMSYNY